MVYKIKYWKLELQERE